jgi:hypothetical protein
VVYRVGRGYVAAEHRPSSKIYGALVATHCSDRFYRHLGIRPVGKSDRCSAIRTMREVNWSLAPEFFRVFLGWLPVVLTSALIFFARSTWRSGDEGGRHRCRTHREGPSGWSVTRLGGVVHGGMPIGGRRRRFASVATWRGPGIQGYDGFRLPGRPTGGFRVDGGRLSPDIRPVRRSWLCAKGSFEFPIRQRSCVSRESNKASSLLRTMPVLRGVTRREPIRTARETAVLTNSVASVI